MTSTPLEPNLKDRIFEICENLYKKSEKVSREKVRAVLGGGSFSTIGPMIKEWNEHKKVQLSSEGTYQDQLEDVDQEESNIVLSPDSKIESPQNCEIKFRIWLKQLRRKGVPMLVLATDPPRADIFINIPRIELKPLPERTIREIMKGAARERSIDLSSADLSKLQERAGGNPMLAIRSIEEEYLGLDIEGADHRRYFDITPLILVVGVIFIIMRFIGLGTNNQSLYIFGGISAAVFLGLFRLFYILPNEERRIR